MTADDFREGDQISFRYDGGSRPGAIRVVDIKQVLSNRIIGYDHYNDAERSFSYNKMSVCTYKYKVPRLKVEYNHCSSNKCDIEMVFPTQESFLIEYNTGVIQINGIRIQNYDDIRKAL